MFILYDVINNNDTVAGNIFLPYKLIIRKSTCALNKEFKLPPKPILTFAFVIGFSLSLLVPVFAQDKEWISLFNGKNLDGWTIKFNKQKLGVNYKNTFRAKDGILSVDYDQYDEFDEDYGHIFYKDKFSNYIIKLEYRFTGEQVKGGPEWGIRNNGIMFHTQSAASMQIVQGWPVSLEMQLLGGMGNGIERQTGNVCTPGTHITLNTILEKTHCIYSNSITYDGDQWVSAELEVRADKIIRHKINGDVVMEYINPIYDGEDLEQPVRPFKTGTPVIDGYIALQAESHNTEFRNIMLLDLDN